MSLATRCPHCNTLFKVTSGQLQTHEGKVRCGQCKAVFSGIEHLTSADTQVWQTLNLGPSGPEQHSNLSVGDPAMQPGAEALFAQHAIKPAPFSLKNSTPAQKWACAALALLLGLQWAWMQRLQWSPQFPGLLAYIEQSSGPIKHWFTQQPTAALVVDGSGLQALDENNVRVDLTLRNASPLPSQWPHLKLDLLDSQGLVLASKALTPADYQVRGQDAASQAAPINGKKTVEVLAYLNLSNLNAQLPESAATGFRLELFDHSAVAP